MSMRIRSGCASRATVSPVSASVAPNTTWPADCSTNVASFMLAALSSTIRTVAISIERVAARHRAPYFSDEAIAIEVGLLHYRRHIAVQLGAVLGSDPLRRHDYDRYLGRFLTLAERLHHVEPIYIRHHEIE